MSDFDDVDFFAKLQQAKERMSGSEYRRRYRAADFITYSAKQWEALNSTAAALYLKAGNQTGKTQVGAGQVGRIATGETIPGCTGWTQPELNLARPHSCVIWCIAPTWQMTRDGIQSRLLGDVASGHTGTGIIPAEYILNVQNARGIAGAVDSVVLRRKHTDTTAVIRFKTYDQGREALQSESVDFVLCDELPDDMGLWHELNARLSATSGILWLTATPRRQQSPIVAWFKEPNHPERQTLNMTIDDASHLTDAMREQMRARYAGNSAEAATRLYGADFAGGGQIFATNMDVYVERIDPNTFPVWIRWIIGFDPGHGGLSDSAHPAGAVLCAWDAFSKTLYVVDCLRLKRALPETLVAAILKWDFGDAPVAWGAAENQGVGSAAETYAQMYRKLGLRMLDRHAAFDHGGVALEPQLDQIEGMLAGGKLKINKKCGDLLEEMQSYERDDKGKPIPLRDDLIAALRYAVLMAPKHSKVLEPNRVRGGIGRSKRREQRIADGMDFDVWTGQ